MADHLSLTSHEVSELKFRICLLEREPVVSLTSHEVSELKSVVRKYGCALYIVSPLTR